MHGKLFVIEGLDGCGKSTQLDILKEKFSSDFRFISFPNYDSPGGEIIKEYLSGAFGNEASEIGCYSASSFYAVDRYISYKKDWSFDYLSGKNIITARYTTSNAIYQMAKLDKKEWDNFLEWLFDYEFVKLGIPSPDKVIFLDMPIEVSQMLLSNRYGGNEQKKDIHEKNIEFMKNCREAAIYVGKKYNWNFISCAECGKPIGVSEINSQIVSLLTE